MQGAMDFYINRAFLILPNIGTLEDPLKKISAEFFKPEEKKLIELFQEHKKHPETATVDAVRLSHGN
jgi:hypothetical protein